MLLMCGLCFILLLISFTQKFIGYFFMLNLMIHITCFDNCHLDISHAYSSVSDFILVSTQVNQIQKTVIDPLKK